MFRPPELNGSLHAVLFRFVHTMQTIDCVPVIHTTVEKCSIQRTTSSKRKLTQKDQVDDQIHCRNTILSNVEKESVLSFDRVAVRDG